jgi:hypothetical protein
MEEDSANPRLWKKSVSFSIDDDPYGLGYIYIVFRESTDWCHYWGGNEFPNGTAIYYGSSIPVPYGTYEVLFNCETLEYNVVSTFGTEEAGSNLEKLTIYPNPAKESFNIRIDNSLNADACNLEIADLSGRVILKKSVSLKTREDKINIDIHQINPGIYLYRLQETSDRTGKSRITANGKLIVIK